MIDGGSESLFKGGVYIHFERDGMGIYSKLVDLHMVSQEMVDQWKRTNLQPVGLFLTIH